MEDVKKLRANGYIYITLCTKNYLIYLYSNPIQMNLENLILHLAIKELSVNFRRLITYRYGREITIQLS